MKLIDIIEALNTSFSIHVIKKDGSFGDCAVVNYKNGFNICAEVGKAHDIAKREGLKLDMITTDPNDNMIMIVVAE